MWLQAAKLVCQNPNSSLFGMKTFEILFMKPLPAETLLVIATGYNSSNEDLLTLSALDTIHVIRVKYVLIYVLFNTEL